MKHLDDVQVIVLTMSKMLFPNPVIPFHCSPSILTWRRGRIDHGGCTPRARLAIALRLAEPCDSPKRGELGRIIYGSGDLRSRYLLFSRKYEKKVH